MYNLDYNQKVVETLVPDKRTPLTIALLQAMVKGIQNNHDQLFQTYKNYQSLPVWSLGAYARDALVIYSKAVYQAVENTTDEPSYSNKWRLVSENYQGTDFRLQIKNEKLIFEYGLNDWFGSVFRQPIDGISDIYLTTNDILDSPFVVGASEINSSVIYSNRSSEFISNNYTFTNQYNLTINVPITLYTALGSTNNIRESIIRNYADKYIPAGLTYNIITY